MLANSVSCTVCKIWIHKRCSGIRGDVSLVVDGSGVSNVTVQSIADVAEDLVVNGETYVWVKSLCYLGDTGGAELVASGRIRNV